MVATAIVSCLILGGLAGCKPTEKNYKAAYDAAKAKRQQAEAESMIPASGLMSFDGPRLRVFDGDSVYFQRQHLRPVADNVEINNYNVVVGQFKMHTNATAQADRLKEKGYDSMAAKGTEDRWYCVAASCLTLDEARAFLKRFKSENKGYPYIGLPDAPVIIERL